PHRRDRKRSRISVNDKNGNGISLPGQGRLPNRVPAKSRQRILRYRFHRGKAADRLRPAAQQPVLCRPPGHGSTLLPEEMKLCLLILTTFCVTAHAQPTYTDADI